MQKRKLKTPAWEFNRIRSGRSSALLVGILPLAFFFGGCEPSIAVPEPDPVERLHVSSQGAISSHGMVSSGNRLASEAGVEILHAGGNAVDAAVATAFAIAVIDVGNAGVGGGGGMMLWLADPGKAEFVDFYSRAGGERGTSGDARNVAVPGHTAGLLEAHERFGRLSREKVLAPAIRLAREGFAVPVNLSASIASHQAKIERYAGRAAVALFLPGGEPLQPGDWLVQEEKAATLERIAAEGRAGFYEGPVAMALVQALNDGGNPITLEDLSSYQAKWTRPLFGGFRDFTVMSAPPPLGGTQVIQTLALLERFELKGMGLPADSVEAAGLIIDAIRTASRDYNSWIFDPGIPVPAVALISPAYAEYRREAIGASTIARSLPAGDPWAFEQADPRFLHLNPFPLSKSLEMADVAGSAGFEDENGDEPGSEHTTHLSVVDPDRNAVAITMTLGPSFGTGFFSAGAFFNNGMTRFSSNRPDGNTFSAYRTPRSNTAPTIVLQNGQVRLVAGAQGGSRIAPAIVYNILYTLEYGLAAGEAMGAPRAFPFQTSPVLRVEAGFDSNTLAGLRARGYTIEPYLQQDPYFAGAHIIEVRPDGRLHGAADLRRAGTAVGY